MVLGLSSSKITVAETAIPGLCEIQLKVFRDKRGYFKESFNQGELLVGHGILGALKMVQENCSFNHTGATRGIHAEPWNKYVSVAFGKVFAAFVAVRAGANFGKLHTAIFAEDKAFFIPEGVGNSFQALVPTAYTYLASRHWEDSAEYKGVNLADPDLRIRWPIQLSNAIISDKDILLTRLKDFEPF